MKKYAKRFLALLLCVMTVMTLLASPISAASASSTGKSGSSISISEVNDILNSIQYADYCKTEAYTKAPKGEETISVDAKDYEKGSKDTTANVEIIDDYYGKDGVLRVGESGKITWKFNVEKAGLYTIGLEYCQIVGKTNSIERIFYLNGEVPFKEARSIVLLKTWKYDDNSFKTDSNRTEFVTDSKGNDIRPSVEAAPEWSTFVLKDADGYYSSPFEFYLEEGENTITLESTREPVVLSQIIIAPCEDVMSYDEYLKLHGEVSENRGSGTIKFQAENPTKVSNVTMYPVYDRTSPKTEGTNGIQSAKHTAYNTFGKEQWQTVGEWVEYDIYVEKSGYYNIDFKYKQDVLDGIYTSRAVYIDGKLPFKEAGQCRFNYTDSWKLEPLHNGTHNFEFYLTEGHHTLRFEAVLGEMSEQIQQVSSSLSNVNACYLEILKLTGSKPDKDRTYNFSRVMPEVMKTLMIESNNLKSVFNYMVETVGKGQQTSTIEQIQRTLYTMASDDNQVPKKLESLKAQLGSLATWINSVKSQPVQVDYIIIQPSDEKVPKADANFFVKLWYEIKLFIFSFFTDYNSIGETSTGEEAVSIDVWVTSGRDQAQIIRNLIDNNFTPQTNITVNLKLISAGTLLPSVLAGVGPDVALFEASNTVIDYALRDAVRPLNKFIEEDLANGEDVLSMFPEAAMVPLTLYDYSTETGKEEATYYGLPDTLTFSMMFYRKDILASLELEVPKTWDELLSLIPELQYNNMEIGILNDIYTFIYQNGENAYADCGTRINFDSVGVLNAFTKLCNMYTQYSLPYQFEFANRFRTGEMPIGIVPYTTCNQLSVFASELSGLWEFVPMPGVIETDENGNTVYDENGDPVINNCAIATVTGCVMLKDCDTDEKQNAAWTFMKWYTGKDFQVAYSNEIVSIMGIAQRPATANTEAIIELPWTTSEANNILAQFGNLEAVRNYPGSYYLARYVNFAFLAAYNDGKDPADSLLSYVTTINKEITRKRAEFNKISNTDYLKDVADKKANENN